MKSGRHHIGFRGGALVALALSATLTPTVFLPTSFAQTPSSSSSITAATVNVAAKLGVVPSTALGVNTAVWDSHLMDSSIPSLLKNIHVSMLRYPGGSTSDVYDWKTNKISGSYADPNNGFDNFMKLADAAHAQPIITVNYGSGTPAQAAAWVRYANVSHHDNVKYWEIGNEMYGSWEQNNWQDKTAKGYATEASVFIKKMKAVDKSIKIGVDLIAPGTGDATWNSTVLNTLHQLGTDPDFGIIHWYAQNPGGETDPGLLSSTDQIATMMGQLKQELQAYPNIQVFVTETNSVSTNPGKQTTSLVNALFLADDYMDWLQSGAQNVDWWDLHNGATAGNASSTLYGSLTYGDYGLLSNGSGVKSATEPAANTPFPDYYGYQMVTHLVRPGASLVGAGSSNEMVAVHASTLPDGSLAVMLINKAPQKTQTVHLNTEGFQAANSAEKWFYGIGSKKVTHSQLKNVKSIRLPAYSVTDLILKPKKVSPIQGPELKAVTQVSEASIKPSHTETVTTTFADIKGTLKKASLDVELYNSAGQMVAQKVVANVSLKPGKSAKPLAVKWKVPDVEGPYTVRAFAFTDKGSTLFADQNAGTFTVTAPDVVVSGDVAVKTTLSTAKTKVGKPVTITTTYTNHSSTDWLSNGILNQYVYLNGKFSTQFAVNGTLPPKHTVTESAVFTPSAAGTYTFPVGTFTTNWGKQIEWYQNNKGPTLTVTK